MPDVYYIPSGPANLGAMFGSINFNLVEEYYIEILGGGTIGTTPHFWVDGCEEDITVSFVNFLGGVDSFVFSMTVEYDVKSSSFERPLSSPLIKSAHGITRNNIKANLAFTGSNTFEESQMDLLEELYASPAAWMQRKAIQGQGVQDIPVVITDKKAIKRKLENRWVYDVSVEFSLSHERIVIQN